MSLSSRRAGTTAAVEDMSTHCSVLRRRVSDMCNKTCVSLVSVDGRLKSNALTLTSVAQTKIDEVFVFDDSSIDSTSDVISNYTGTGSEKIRVFRNNRNLGYGGNQKRGYLYAIENGFDVVCDKPLSLNSDEAKELVRIKEETGKLFALTHTYAGYPMVKEARQLAQNGDLGKLRKIVVEYPQGWLSTKVEACF